MKVLIVSHSYITAMAQRKLQAMAKDAELDLTLVVPTFWKYELRDIALEKRHDERYRIIACRVAFSGHINAHYYWPHVFLAVKNFNPDILHIEQEPTSLSAWQWLLFNRVRWRARTILFTWENQAAQIGWVKRKIKSFNLRQLDHIIVGNRAARDLLRRQGFQRGITLMPLVGIDTEQFAPARSDAFRRSLDLASFQVVGYVGRLVKEKGLFDLIEACAPLPSHVKLALIGSGPLRAEIEATAQRLGFAERLLIVNAVPHDQVPRYMNCLDVFVLPSRTTPHWAEQFGHVLIEAMACGVPVIGADAGAIPEAISDAGLVYREGDVLQLRAHLACLLNEPASCATLSERGRARVLACYTNEVIARKTLDLYRVLIR